MRIKGFAGIEEGGLELGKGQLLASSHVLAQKMEVLQRE